MLVGVVLEAAFAGLIADRAVQRVVDEQELHDRPLRLVGVRRGGADDHAVLHHLGGAGGLELAHAFDLDHAHAALADDRQARVIAVVGDLNSDLESGFDQVGAGGHLDRASVDGQGRHQAAAPWSK